ncbi:MAG: deoxyribodipyrimidine photo-lyase [Bacillus subtilis]|nr:deoxyribodipyrimidine photo-lyase [Bacillus subtilis]
MFVLAPEYPNANRRHYTFMMEGIAELFPKLAAYGATPILRLGQPEKVVASYFVDAADVVFDIGYTRIQREWRKQLYKTILEHHPYLNLWSAESDVVVPVREASDKTEYGAYTLRGKLHRKLAEYLVEPVLPSLSCQTTLDLASDFPVNEWRNAIATWHFDATIRPVEETRGGREAALAKLEVFLSTKIARYPESNDPSLDLGSQLSPYLHFGQLSSLEILLALKRRREAIPQAAFDGFVEQLFIRRELAINFIFFTEGYDAFDTMTLPWAYRTMAEHENDPRSHRYTKAQLIAAATHDEYWNACMNEMVYFGTMPNYMRMYWAKKIIEWTSDYRTAYETLKDLNDTYFLDGRDANGYTGIAWCFGRHDRPWTERPVFGTLRYMNAQGLKRKFDIDSYTAKITSKCMLLGVQTSEAYNEIKE